MTTFDSNDHPRDGLGRFKDKPEVSAGISLSETITPERAFELAGDPDLDAATLRQIAEMDDEHLRVEAAAHQNSDEYTVRILSQDKSSRVRREVARRPAQLPLDVEGRLSRDPDVFNRRELARRKDLRSGAVQLMIYDEDSVVRRTVLGLQPEGASLT